MAKMQELIDAGLFGRGLVFIKDRTLIDRYNACLEDMGLKKTKCGSFHIDRMGWSSEIAAEQGNEFYLSHGDANPLAILITPEQIGAPIYFAFHSFDWRMMDSYEKAHRLQILELTKEHGTWLDIDQVVDIYRTPADLGLVTEVMVRSHVPGGIIEKAQKQRALSHRFMHEQESFLDDELIKDVRASYNDIGDVRFRSMIIRDFQYSDVRDFYSRALGGVFIFRSKSEKPLIICCNTATAEKNNEFAIDESAVRALKKGKYLDCNIDWWSHNLHVLKVIGESYLVDVLDEVEPELEFFSQNPARQRGIVKKYASKLDVYLEIFELHKKLEMKKRCQIPSTLASTLCHPSPDLSPSSREVVGQLLTYVNEGRFVPYFYRHQKQKFVNDYLKKWNAPKRQWARFRIGEYYEHLHGIKSIKTAA